MCLTLCHTRNIYFIYHWNWNWSNSSKKIYNIWQVDKNLVHFHQEKFMAKNSKGSWYTEFVYYVHFCYKMKFCLVERTVFRENPRHALCLLSRFGVGSGSGRASKETLSWHVDAECLDWTRVALITAITRASVDTVRTKGARRGFAAANVFSLCTWGGGGNRGILSPL